MDCPGCNTTVEMEDITIEGILSSDAVELRIDCSNCKKAACAFIDLSDFDWTVWT